PAQRSPRGLDLGRLPPAPQGRGGAPGRRKGRARSDPGRREVPAPRGRRALFRGRRTPPPRQRRAGRVLLLPGHKLRRHL
ncbi:MAG: hypothetical protein AVDCRST_MAG05-617, partial [uncultured Rubrobacteraceae bacterium]